MRNTVKTYTDKLIERYNSEMPAVIRDQFSKDDISVFTDGLKDLLYSCDTVEEAESMLTSLTSNY